MKVNGINVTDVRKWIDAELRRTAGQNLTDLSPEDQDRLVELFAQNSDVRQAVKTWRREER
jgi:hypothetical protein